jgi:hypothetical protein
MRSYGGLGHDRLYDGSEDDQLFGDNVTVTTSGGNDVLDSGEKNGRRMRHGAFNSVLT